ncbi:hypothetical protein BU17DRAFT_54716, partial [Hysterangium stoloniferum]
LFNSLIATIIFYNRQIPKDPIWSQILTIYSLLFTCGISIIRKQLTRIHAIIAVATSSSPSSAYVIVYAIRSVWEDGHRMDTVYGKDHILRRVVAIAALPIWMGLAAYTMLPNYVSHFTQLSCQANFERKLFKAFLFLPFVFFDSVADEAGPMWSIILGLPVELTILSWFIAIWLSRHKIWPRGERFKFRFRTVRHHKHPFILFLSVVVIPSAYWVLLIEIGAVNSSDANWSQPAKSFGQVLAVFVTIPPIIAPCSTVFPLVRRLDLGSPPDL